MPASQPPTTNAPADAPRALASLFSLPAVPALPAVMLLLALLAAPLNGCAGAHAVRLDEGNFAAWRDHLAPQPSELAWESLPWLTSYADGVLAAQEQRRPLLLWVMNGHPLGCT